MKHVWYECDFCKGKVEDALHIIEDEKAYDMCLLCWLKCLEALKGKE